MTVFKPDGEEVRASVNVAYLAQKIADCDSIVFPMWSSGLLDPEAIVPIISSGIAIVIEGGDPSVRDKNTFGGAKSSLDDLQILTEKTLLSRSPTSTPAIFICLGHQLAAQAHINLIQKAVKQVLQPELLSDLRVIGDRQAPSDQELKTDDGARLFARLLFAVCRSRRLGDEKTG